MESERHPSIRAAVVLSALHLPCCALPLAALALGASGAVAPWATRWAAIADYTLPLAALGIALAWWRLAGHRGCPRARRQRWILAAATGVLLASAVAGHTMLPTVAVAAAH